MIKAEPLAVRIVAALVRRGEHLATAESLTGGLIGAAVTAVAGASRAYLGGVVAATVKPGVTFAFMYLSKESDFDADVELFNQMLDSFDILVSGVQELIAGTMSPDEALDFLADPYFEYRESVTG
mgnify:CR=1 FL=1